jgi:hypothetical protein
MCMTVRCRSVGHRYPVSAPKLCELLHITAILFPGGARVQVTTANLVKSTTKKPLDGLTRLVDLPRSQKEEPNR